MRTRTDTAGYWRSLIRRQDSSGLTVSAFCERAGVSEPSFYSWRRRLRSEVTFTEVKVSREQTLAHAASASRVGGIELRLPDDRCVVVRPGFDRQTLLDLLDVLETARCRETPEAGA